MDFKIRDTRNGEWFWVNRLVLEHPYLTSSSKLVYSALTYFANKAQKVYPSFQAVAKLTRLKRITVIKAVKQLEEYYFIKVERKTGKVNQYILLKLTDSKPVKKIYQYIKGTGGVRKRDHVGLKRGTTNKTNTTRPNNNKPLSLLEELLQEKRRDLQIIGLWVKEMNLEMPNKAVRGNIVKRNLRAAGLLKGYENDRIIETINVLRKTDYLTKFTLETVTKYIDEVISKRKSQGRKILRFEEVKKEGKVVAMRPIYAEKIRENN